MEETKSIEDNTVAENFTDEENALIEKNGTFLLLSEERSQEIACDGSEAESNQDDVLIERGNEFGEGIDNTQDVRAEYSTDLNTGVLEGGQSGSQTYPDGQSQNQSDKYVDNQFTTGADDQSDDLPKGEGDWKQDSEYTKETMSSEKTCFNQGKERTTSTSMRRSKTTHEMIESARKEHSAKVRKSKEETAKREQEKRDKDERNKRAFEAWCRKKEEEDRQRKEKERQDKEKIYQDMDDKNRKQEEDARKCFHEWMKKKNTQAQQDKLLQEFKRQEEQSILYTRTQEDSDAAFARWLKQKKQQEEQQLKLIRQRNKRISKMRQRWERYNYRSFFDNTSL